MRFCGHKGQGDRVSGFRVVASRGYRVKAYLQEKVSGLRWPSYFAKVQVLGLGRSEMLTQTLHTTLNKCCLGLSSCPELLLSQHEGVVGHPTLKLAALL